MTSQMKDFGDLMGLQVVDRAGDKIGQLRHVYVDGPSGQPEWLAISTGTFEERSSLVPMEGAVADGGHVIISWTRAAVEGAPQVEDDAEGFLSPEEEGNLDSYWDQQETISAATRAGHDASGPTIDHAVVRSEEHVAVGARRQESGRARLRKYVDPVPIGTEKL